MRGAPQVGFSATMRRINSRNSLLTHFLPTGVRCRESHLQYNLTRSVPANNSLRLDEDQRPIPSPPKPSQDHPEEFVRNTKPRLRTPSLQNSKLLPQCQVFQEQIAA